MMQRKKAFRSKLIFMLTAFFVLSFAGNAHSGELIIDSLVSDHGPASGGGGVAIVGSFFSEGMSISFDGIPATDIKVYFPVWVTCKAPPHEAGSVDIVVTTPNGQSASCEQCYTYDPPPQISEISPAHGPASGGAIMNIKGENFLEGMTVAFGGIPAGDVVLVSDTEATCTTPGYEAGSVDVVVTNPDNQSASCQACYVYDPPPTITQMEPCPAYAGTSVSISGENFADGATITFDGIPATEITVSSSSLSHCKTPANAEGMPREVLVSNPDGQSDIYACTSLPSPKIVAPIAYGRGPVSGGTEITIMGYHFLEGVRVAFDGIPASDVRLISDTKIRCITPGHEEGTADVAVTNPDNQMDTCTGCYTYEAGFSISPSHGTTEGGTEITIKGENFSEGIAVSFSDTSAMDVVFLSSSEIRCQSPANQTGTASITLTYSDGGTDTCTDCYIYLSPSEQPIKIGKVSDPQGLGCQTSSAILWSSEIMALNPPKRVWAIIILPNLDPLTPITELPSAELEDSDNDGIYEGRYEYFDLVNETYKIGFYAENEEGYSALPLPSSVIRTCQKGDLDRDDEIGLKDVIIGLKVLTEMSVSLPDDPAYKIIDADGDEKVGLAEVVYILRKLAESP